MTNLKKSPQGWARLNERPFNRRRTAKLDAAVNLKPKVAR